ncbi:receptor protein kinase-like protein ZAR1 [Oryza brachyantha]|uniref:receptor protein kinase-like protein ZAR1 n=1 Tax=Oryza brachyantha TaxID=4533 RepID=UPI001ADAD8B0|nr:receptor protein kinase-like protein ZAR1 [Oryza brachyantha]
MRSLLLQQLLLLLAAAVAAAALSPDGVALLAFKTAVTDDPSGALSGWSDADADPCRWAGVTCANTSSSGARVVGVAVAGKNLSGYVPSVLGSLAFLRRLNLHGNRLSGTVPPALANATSLRSLFLYGNSLTGGLPPELCDLPRLQNLDLSDNSLSGALPPELGRCKQLQRLMLSGNGLSGEIPATVWPEMVSLQLLDLSSNSLTGAIPPELGKLAALAGTLNLSRNHLSGGVPPELGHLPATVTLDLRFNNLSGEIPQSGSLASQGPTAFLNNPGLCGFPLQVPCRAAAPSSSSPPPPSAAGSLTGAGGPRQPIKTSLIVLISVADAAGVALIGVIVVYIYWKLRDRRGDGGGDDDEEEGKGLFPCPCMRADDSSDGSDGDGDAKCNSGGGGGGEEGELVAIDKGFRMELDELLRSSAYVLGKGGKGIVYKVVVGNGTTPVAVRRLGGGAAAPERYKEFAAEAGAIGRVRHANVVRLRAYYWSADEKLVVTDFVNNGNLATALRGRSGQASTLSWSVRLRIAKGAARGLAHLHECSPRRFVHGEVKPSNILLDADYNALLADFGLARLLAIVGCADPSSASAAGGIMGCALPPPYAKPPAATDRGPSAAYRAPEARGTGVGARPSQKSDVYSFGVVLLELLTGRPPEHGASPSASASASSSASFPGTAAAAADQAQQVAAPELVRWVQRGFEDARPLSELADAAVLRDAGARKEVVAAFHVALGCVEAEPERRPRMKAVADSLDKIGS